jgi:hypothetical protein
MWITGLSISCGRNACGFNVLWTQWPAAAITSLKAYYDHIFVTSLLFPLSFEFLSHAEKLYSEVRQILWPFAADLLADLSEFFHQDGDGLVATFSAHGSDCIHKGSA